MVSKLVKYILLMSLQSVNAAFMNIHISYISFIT